jgi:hypothetical protein
MILGITASSRVATAAAGPAFRSVATASSTSSTGITCAMPTGFAAGDILVMQVSIAADPKTATTLYSSGLPPTGWTARSSYENYSGDLFQMDTFTKTATGSEGSLTWSGTNWYASSMSIVAVSGATAVDVVGAAPGSLVAPSVTTTTTSDFLIGLWSNWSGSFYGLGTITKPASMTQRAVLNPFNTPQSTYLNTTIATEKLTASGATGTRTATVSNSLYYVTSTLLAVK